MAWTRGYEVRLTEEWEGAASGDRPCASERACQHQARRIRQRAAFPPGCLPENWTCRYPGYTSGSLELVSPLRPVPTRHISWREWLFLAQAGMPAAGDPCPRYRAGGWSKN